MRQFIFTLLAFFIISSLAAQTIEVPQKQQSLVTKHTATWCPFCGLEEWDLQKFFLDNLDGNNAIVMGAHISSTSKLYSQTAKELLMTYQGVVYQPEFFHNTSKITGNIESIKTMMSTKVSDASQQSPLAQTGILVTYNPTDDTLKVKTNTKFFSAAEGTYQLSILLLQREVYAEQANRGSNVLHRNIIRKSLNPTTFGPEIASGTIAAGTEASHEVALKWNNQYELNNVKFVVILWKRNATKYDFVNGNSTTTIQQEQTTSTRRTDALGNRFAILPNAVKNNALIQLDLPTAFNNAEITLFDQYGRRVRTVHRGSLPAGQQQFTLERTGAEAAGIYFLRFKSGNTVATRRVIFL
ncbi:MAG: Omp28-related outer membrane protein [Saprospiraceae bacterium]|nr:Omp28-related outer membrane protein [Saprospiraceae bacterium]